MAKNKYTASRFDDVSSYSSKKEYKKRRKNRRGRTVLKSITAVLCSLIIVFGSLLIYVSTNVVDGLSTVNLTRDKDKLGISDTATSDSSIKNIAFFGVDDRNVDSFKGLSDVIMILSVDTKHNKLKMTSVLRDSLVIIDGNNQKINAAYSLGGYELAIKTLNENLNLDIEDYVTVNFNGMAHIIDGFGGVTLELTKKEAEQTNENIRALMYEQIHKNIEQTVFDSDQLPDEDGGKYDLNGNQAVAYARIRKNVENSGDEGRVSRQKEVLTALLKKLSQMNVTEYPAMLSSLLSYCETSMSYDDIWSLSPILTGDSYKVESLTIPGEYEAAVGEKIGAHWYYIYDFERAAKNVSLFIYEELSPFYDASSSGASSVSSSTSKAASGSSGSENDD